MRSVPSEARPAQAVEPNRASSRYDLGTVNKALDVVEHLARHREETLDSLARAVGMPKSTVFRLVHTLERRGYAVRGPSGSLGLGPRVLWLVSADNRNWVIELQKVAHPHLVALRDEFGDTVNLAVRSTDHVVYIDVVEGIHPLRFIEVPGTIGPLHATALGKALLAYLPAVEQKSVISSLRFEPLTPRTITDPESFRAELAATAGRGYALDDWETADGAKCVAVPILDRKSAPIAAISLSMPDSRFTEEKRAAATVALSAACQAIADAVDSDSRS